MPPHKRLDAHAFYAVDALCADFDNDGWLELVVLDRSKMDQRAFWAMLLMNRGDGTFELKPTSFSGLDSSGIYGQLADLSNDALLDPVSAAGPDNSGLAQTMGRCEDKVYGNTGLHGARQNHWLRLRFSGVGDPQPIGARVEVREVGKGKLLKMLALAANDSNAPLPLMTATILAACRRRLSDLEHISASMTPSRCLTRSPTGSWVSGPTGS
jgi:hypothetical protein